jgi:HK97 family phage major capsid protein
MSQDDVAPGTAPELSQGAQRSVIEQLATETYSALRPLLERAAAEQSTGGQAAAETREAIDRVQDRLDQLEREYARAQVHSGATSGAGAPERAEAFREWMRTGTVPPETAAMIVADPQTGGFLAPNEFVAEVLKGVVEFSPLRSVARTMQTDSRAVVMPKRTQVAAATWIGETDARNETQNPAYGQEEIPTHELHARADISLQNLEDSAFDLDSMIVEEFGEQFGVAEGEAFIAGNGVARPAGILVHPDIETVNSGAASAVTGDGLIKLYFALKDAYARNATWVMRRSTIRDIRILKDGQGNYLWQPGIAGVGPATILDRPYIEAKDMPAVAASAKAIALGDFRRGYLIVDRIAMQVQRDPYTRKGFMVFIGRRRVGGQVILAEAIKTQTIAA